MRQQDRWEDVTRDRDPRGTSGTPLPGEVEKGEEQDTVKRVEPGQGEPQGPMSSSERRSRASALSSAQAIEEADTDTVQEPPVGDLYDHGGGEDTTI